MSKCPEYSIRTERLALKLRRKETYFLVTTIVTHGSIDDVVERALGSGPCQSAAVDKAMRAARSSLDMSYVSGYLEGMRTQGRS